ncbi:hypothetical protein [Streptomyces sp. SM12]|uniref:hypothetical protein n=1 Tax=Streptomyces sp. SM12 TaxID=1071602 RepID=UPI000CD4DFA2|nr:hypothetical protein [Streptomyces sp. SM12]
MAISSDHNRKMFNRRRDSVELDDMRVTVDGAVQEELLAGTPHAEIAQEAGITLEAIRQIARERGLPDGRLSEHTTARQGRYLDAPPDTAAPGAATLLADVAEEMTGVRPPVTDPELILTWIETNTRCPLGHYLGVADEPSPGGGFAWGVWPGSH